MDVTVYRVSAFPSNGNGGNEAGVVIDADRLSEAMMKKIAQRVNYSETAFLLKSERADFRLRYFTPTIEVPVCGHATIATFNMMRNLGRVETKPYTLETQAGVFDIIIDESTVKMQLAPPKLIKTLSKEDIVKDLALSPERFNDYPMELITSGIKEIFLGMKTVADVHGFIADEDKISALCKKHGAEGLYIYTLETLGVAEAHGRNFAPCLGIIEESATGTASAALAEHLHRHHAPTRTRFRFEQGHAMFKPSQIDVFLSLQDNRIVDLHIGGTMRFIDKIVGFNAAH